VARRIGIVAIVALLLAPLQMSLASTNDVLDEYLKQIADSLPEKTAEALKQIDGTPRRLLAARAYLQAGDSLRSRWSWTAEEISAHARSPEYRALLAETEKVRARFESQNPGYTLYANTEARSLELQIARFNTNPSVGKVAASLYKQALAEVGKPAYDAPDQADDVERFKSFLTRWRPATAAPLAAPGISRHGQLRAIDFQIMKDGAVVAPTETATVKRNWDAPGWTKKLQAAVEGSNFRGPLQSPYEPWHYEYDP
jgi:lipoprotein-anchoring transpeptidase ErfK/SrfK